MVADCKFLKEEDGAVGLFQSLFGAARGSESCSKSRSEGSTVEVTRLVELGLKGEQENALARSLIIVLSTLLRDRRRAVFLFHIRG